MNAKTLITDDVEQETSTVLQLSFEKLYSKYQTVDVIRDNFCNAGFVEAFQEHNVEPVFGIDFLTQMYLHIRCKPKVIINCLLKHFIDWENPAQKCAEEIERLFDLEFVLWDEDEFQFVSRFMLTDDLVEKINQFQYPLPMVEPPLKIHRNNQTGYLTISGSLLLKKNHHKDDICIDHINRLNQVPLSINTNVLSFVQNSWRDLDKRKATESQREFQKRQKAFQKYDEASKAVLKSLISVGENIWFTHRFCKRGRTYCQGYHANYQGNSWNKACIELGQKELLK